MKTATHIAAASPRGAAVGTRVRKVIFYPPGAQFIGREKGGGSRGPVDFISLPRFPLQPSMNEGAGRAFARGW
jgi:hypothetical protein